VGGAVRNTFFAASTQWAMTSATRIAAIGTAAAAASARHAIATVAAVSNVNISMAPS
jgi:hypothetical protein